ncbi:MAG: hypothetical protein JXM69_21835 [Anaerolineae bacterium]|nr:hypothetical protein [Anaerolineae bacterium]
MHHPNIKRAISQITVLLLGPIWIGLILALLPAPTPVQAAANVRWSDTALQSSPALTIYLPLIHRSPTPEEQLIALINAERSRNGRSPLSINPLLMQAAEAHSQDMVNRNFFDHINPDGQDPGDRLDNVGYNYAWAGETIGAGYTTPQAMFNAWMNSSGHRDILMEKEFTEIGIGYVTGGYYGHYWTADLARPAP